MGDWLPWALCKVCQGAAGDRAKLRQAAPVHTHTHTHISHFSLALCLCQYFLLSLFFDILFLFLILFLKFWPFRSLVKKYCPKRSKEEEPRWVFHCLNPTFYCGAVSMTTRIWIQTENDVFAAGSRHVCPSSPSWMSSTITPVRGSWWPRRWLIECTESWWSTAKISKLRENT